MPFVRYPSLEDRGVLITGGGSGIGASIVRAFAQQGAKVAFLDIQEQPSTALARELAGTARHAPLFIPCDLTDLDALRGAVDEAAARHGPITVLVNNAADDRRHEIDEVSPGFWRRALAVNLDHLFFAAQACRPMMRDAGGGSIINLSSIAWMRGAPRLPAYAAAKAAIVGLTKSLGAELGRENIRVNAIAPGAVMTEKQLRLWYTEASAAEVASRQAIPRRLEPDEIARTALFLAADDSRMITKQCIVVDAGLL